MRSLSPLAVRRCAVLLALAGATSLAGGPSGADEKVSVQRDLLYARRRALALKGDVYRPERGGPHPAVVLIHGGGFVGGDRTSDAIPPIASFLAGRGFVVFAIDYRLMQQGGLFPGAVQDVRCAVRGLVASAERLGVDTRAVSLVGPSAGGHLAAFTAVTWRHRDLDGPCGVEADRRLDGGLPDLAAAVAWYGAHDVTTLGEDFFKNVASLKLKLDEPPASFARRYSPITWADEAPPLLLLHGDADRLVPVAQSRQLCAAATRAGRDCTLVEVPDAGHGFVDEEFGSPRSLQSLELTVTWLQAHLARRPHSDAGVPDAGR